MNRLAFTLIALVIAAAVSAGEATVTPEESARVLENIRQKNRPYFEQYRGIESLRTIVIRQYAPDTNKLLVTEEVTMRRRDYTYEKPEVTILTYRKNGEVLKPGDFKERIADPVYPVFDEQGRTHYDVRVTGIEVHEGIRCYRIEVDPLQKTERHVRAILFYDAATLAPVSADGTLGKVPYPLTDFRMTMRMAEMGTVPVARSIMMTLRVKVPLFFDRRFITEITVKENTLIPR